MPQVVVIIPTYKKDLKESEKIALQQCQTKLHTYPIVFVAPQDLDADYMQGYETQRFDNHYFTGIAGYNELLMSSIFYERFTQYEFMLICQLDALVLKDELAYWCAKDYDYIGATWLDKDRNFFRRLVRNIKTWKYIRKLKGMQVADNQLKMGYITHGKVGNGGFSLRKTEAMLKVVKLYPDWIQRILKTTIPEDVFFSILVNLYQTEQLRIAPYKEGIKFAFEMYPEKAYKLNGNQLPFGCHDFDDWSQDFWKKHLPTLTQTK
jgi:hypothetical protein